MANFKRIAKRVVSLALALFVALGLLGWYGLHALQVRQVRETPAVIERFHQHLNAGDFDKICDEAIACSESEEARHGWILSLQDVVRRAGKFREVKRSGIEAHIKPFEVRADYVCSFEKTDVREIFILRGSDSAHVRILNYLIPTNPALPADRQEFK